MWQAIGSHLAAADRMAPQIPYPDAKLQKERRNEHECKVQSTQLIYMRMHSEINANGQLHQQQNLLWGKYNFSTALDNSERERERFIKFMKISLTMSIFTIRILSI